MTIHTGNIALPDLFTLLATAWNEGAHAGAEAATGYDTLTNPYDGTTWKP